MKGHIDCHGLNDHDASDTFPCHGKEASDLTPHTNPFLQIYTPFSERYLPHKRKRDSCDVKQPGRKRIRIKITLPG